MTEQEWLTSTDPAAMLELYTSDDMPWPAGTTAPTISERKLRLSACAFCRQSWHLLRDDLSKKAIETAEKFADGEATREETFRLASSCMTIARCLMPTWDSSEEADMVIESAQMHNAAILPTYANIFREIIGNPWRPITLPSVCLNCGSGTQEPEVDYACCGQCGRTEFGCPWLTPTVLSLTTAAYEERPGRKCERCSGSGWIREHDGYIREDGYGSRRTTCPDCYGNCYIEDGTLDPFRLTLLADALEEAGCVGEMCMACDGRGRKRYADMEDEEPDAVCLNCSGAGRLPQPILRHLRGWRMCSACNGTGTEMGTRQDMSALPLYKTKIVTVPCSGISPRCVRGWRHLPGPHVRGCHVLDLVLGKK